MDEIRKMTSEFQQLRELWCDVFGDKESYVTAFYDAWGSSIEGYILEGDGRVKAAATLFRMGDLVIPADKIVSSKCSSAEQAIIKPCYVSYAICTNKEDRGKGYGSAITEYLRDVALSRDGVSMLCPAEPSLVKFYQPLSYEPRFYATAKKFEIDDSLFDELDNKNFEINTVSAFEYNALREEFLKDTVHVRLNDAAVNFLDLNSRDFVTAYDNNIIAVIDHLGSKNIYFSEVIANSEVPAETLQAFLAEIARVYGKKSIKYRCPGSNYLQTGELGTEYVQAMIAGNNLSDGGFRFSQGYFGFPFD